MNDAAIVPSLKPRVATETIQTASTTTAKVIPIDRRDNSLADRSLDVRQRHHRHEPRRIGLPESPYYDIVQSVFTHPSEIYSRRCPDRVPIALPFQLSLFGIVSIVSATAALMAALSLRLLPAKRDCRPYWLIVFLSLVGVSASTQALAEMSLFESVPATLIVVAALPFLAAPALYAYTCNVLGIPVPLRHLFVPTIIIGFLLSTLWWYSIGRDGSFLTAEGAVMAIVFYCLSIAYASVSIGKLIVLRRIAPDNFSDLKNTGLAWLIAINAAYILVLVTDASLGYLLADGAIKLHHAGAMLSLALTVFIAGMSVIALRQPVGLRAIVSRIGEKYASSGLSDSDLESLAIRLDRVMRERRIYLESDLTLASLAREVGAGRHQLSQLINLKFGRNFYAYVNEFRIGHAKKLLERRTFSVLQVAFECGYNNKASFYRAFRELCGVTPTEYRKIHRGP